MQNLKTFKIIKILRFLDIQDYQNFHEKPSGLSKLLGLSNSKTVKIFKNSTTIAIFQYCSTTIQNIPKSQKVPRPLRLLKTSKIVEILNTDFKIPGHARLSRSSTTWTLSGLSILSELSRLVDCQHLSRILDYQPPPLTNFLSRETVERGMKLVTESSTVSTPLSCQRCRS